MCTSIYTLKYFNWTITFDLDCGTLLTAEFITIKITETKSVMYTTKPLSTLSLGALHTGRGTPHKANDASNLKKKIILELY